MPEEPVAWGPTTTVNDAIVAWREHGWEDSLAQDRWPLRELVGKPHPQIDRPQRIRLAVQAVRGLSRHTARSAVVG